MLCRERILPSRAAQGYMSWRDEQRSRHRWLFKDVRGDRLLGNAMERAALGSELDGNPAERRTI